MTIVAIVAAFYVLLIAANCRVFRAMHRRDEEIDRFYAEHVATYPPLRKTGS